MQNLKVWWLLFWGSPFAQWLYKVSRDTALTYYGSAPFVPNKQWVVGLVVAVLSGIIHSSPTDPAKKAMLKATLRMIFLFAFAFALAAPSFAYDFNVPALGSHSKLKNLSAIPSGLDENAVVGIPTAALAVGTVSTSYGLSISYSALWCHIKGASGSDTSTLTSKFGIGASAYGDFGGWLESNFVESPRLKVGVGVILPQMCGITPGVMEVWDVRNGGKAAVVTMNVPLNLLNSMIFKF